MAARGTKSVVGSPRKTGLYDAADDTTRRDPRPVDLGDSNSAEFAWVLQYEKRNRNKSERVDSQEKGAPNGVTAQIRQERGALVLTLPTITTKLMPSARIAELLKAGVMATPFNSQGGKRREFRADIQIDPPRETLAPDRAIVSIIIEDDRVVSLSIQGKARAGKDSSGGNVTFMLDGALNPTEDRYDEQ
jgi:hypothetical protein